MWGIVAVIDEGVNRMHNGPMTFPTFHLGDCITSMRAMPDASVDSIVTDPPYELTASKRTKPAPFVEGSPYSRHRVGVNGDNKPVGGFMGHEWDGSGIAFSVEMWAEALRVLKPGGHLLAFSGSRTYHRMVCAIEDAGFEIRDQIQWIFGSGFPKSRNISADMDGDAARQWQGWGTALKPAHEPICVARKPLVGTVAANVLQFGTGAINVDGCRIAGEDAPEGRSRHGGGLMQGSSYQMPDSTSCMPAGRWPANLIHSGEPEVLAAFPDSNGSGPARTLKRGERSDGWGMADEPGELRDAGTGSAARFFYCAKASKADRNSGGIVSSHPTVKPTDLMRYLCRLVTPPGGLVLDPFMGSGSTGKAAVTEGFRFVGCELQAEYLEIARARVTRAWMQANGFGGLL